MPSDSTLILIIRVIFAAMAISCLFTGIIVLAVAPAAFLVALGTLVTGAAMMFCCYNVPEHVKGRSGG